MPHSESLTCHPSNDHYLPTHWQHQPLLDLLYRLAASAVLWREPSSCIVNHGSKSPKPANAHLEAHARSATVHHGTWCIPPLHTAKRWPLGLGHRHAALPRREIGLRQQVLFRFWLLLSYPFTYDTSAVQDDVGGLYIRRSILVFAERVITASRSPQCLESRGSESRPTRLSSSADWSTPWPPHGQTGPMFTLRSRNRCYNHLSCIS